LGSGPSINAITDQEWQHFAAYDTVGFNFWLFHPFVPRFYFCEAIPQQSAGKMFATFAEIARERATDYEGVDKYIMEIESADPPGTYPLPELWRRDIRTVLTMPVAARSTEEISYGIEYLRRENFFEAHNECFFKQLSTLSFLIGFGAKLRYRRIVLCGVDLTTGGYFYQDADRYPRWQNLQFVDPASPHPTASPLLWRVPIQDVVYALKRQVLDVLGIELYVQSRDSALHPQVAVMPADFFFR
jgi:hypothetical protein